MMSAMFIGLQKRENMFDIFLHLMPVQIPHKLFNINDG